MKISKLMYMALLLLLFQIDGFGQKDETKFTRVIVAGNAVVSADPDTSILVFAVVSQANRALDAQQENANRTDAVIKAIKNFSPAVSEVMTSGYALEPRRIYRENQPPTIVGYEVRNRVTVTTPHLTRVGNLIDVAVQAGANNVESISFILKKDEAAKRESLQKATRNAMENAQAIAQTMGGRLVAVREISQDIVIPRPMETFDVAEVSMGRAAQVSTPIQAGSLEVRSGIRLIAEIDIPAIPAR